MKTQLLIILGLLAMGLNAFAADTKVTGPLIVRTASGTAATCESSDSTGDLCVADDVHVDDDLLVGGDATITGALTTTGGAIQAIQTVAAVTTLTSASCGKLILVTAGIDTASITLPATIAGCVLTFVYTGADGGALVDISPNASDGIHGNCTLAASILTFSGTDDADIGITKATGLTADGITLVGDGAVGWFAKSCQGIWANN